MDTSIVCGIDGSADSDAALTVAARLANRLGSRLVLAHVAEPALTPYAYEAPFGGLTLAGPRTEHQEIHEQQEAGERLLAQRAKAAGISHADHRVAVGLPAERLAEIADDEDAELIVVGSRGRGALKAAFLGSVSNSLVGIARCPVLIVPQAAGESGKRYGS
jgi:nucleotide-binding universal stress UspA family protein